LSTFIIRFHSFSMSSTFCIQDHGGLTAPDRINIEVPHVSTVEAFLQTEWND